MLYFSRWKIVGILAVIFLGLLAVVPNFLPESVRAGWPSFLPDRRIVLGLDLQGGAYLLYEVDRQDYEQRRMRTLVGEIRDALRRDPRIGYTGLGVQGNAVQLKIRDLGQLDEARRRLDPLKNTMAGSILTGGGGSVDEFAVDFGDDGTVRFTFTDAGLTQRIRSIVDQSIEVIRKRVDELGTTEPNIQREGEDRILVEAPGLQDPGRLKALVGQTALLTFHLVDTNASMQQSLQGRPPPGTMVLNSTDDPPTPYVVEETPLLTGEDLIDAQATFDQRTNEPVVSFRLSTGGARKFGLVTQENVGRPFAIVLDNEVISAPVIREPILGGSGQISGNFSVQGANDLAILLRAGALPAKLTIVEERTVGPGLGADSIRAGIVAAVVGSIAVVVFMILAYGFLGIIADVAVIVNVFLMLGVMSLLEATLTLPGIAGIVLTIGMAVDSNVLIYERIREESRLGRSAISAIDSGFAKALGTILDANITTLIAAVVLFYLGSGPVRGFAVTLALGIITTIFTAYLFTRLLVALWVRRARPTTVPI
jgi:preprotein translocase subunit SecD